MVYLSGESRVFIFSGSINIQHSVGRVAVDGHTVWPRMGGMLPECVNQSRDEKSLFTSAAHLGRSLSCAWQIYIVQLVYWGYFLRPDRILIRPFGSTGLLGHDPDHGGTLQSISLKHKIIHNGEVKTRMVAKTAFRIIDHDNSANYYTSSVIRWFQQSWSQSNFFFLK